MIDMNESHLNILICVLILVMCQCKLRHLKSFEEDLKGRLFRDKRNVTKLTGKKSVQVIAVELRVS